MEFDNTLKGDTNYNNYEGVCEGIVKNYGEEKAKHKDFCMKLVRNLGCYNLNTKYYNPNNDRCIILYNWIHNTKKNYIHSDEIITKCFNDYIEFMDRTIGNYMCSYDSYNAIYEDPIKMTILDIFNNNMQNIKRKLMEEREKGKFSAQNFVCGSVNIYRKMYRNYCNDQNARDKEHKNTCDQLNALRTIYNSYIFQNVDLKNKIPALDDREEEFWDKCKSDEKLPEKAVVAGPEEPTLQHSYRDEGESTPQAMPYEVDNVEKQVNPTSSTVSTAVGTVAGASSILALLYKVNKEFHLNV
ncbi:hypothetical protein PVMG_05337 [Plasmodium vivax Mauritania I]|uniref:Uncharacterized protein n=1 Tax=Plasmodium vivax Mauritania I TaxID=1035515 RepID=A0A0J9W5J5_PLAVI|nr:hypothetical protein PVMG_05337 [Plasmodium vivax Mauritania I]